MLQHTSRSTRTVVRDLDYRLDVNTLHRDDTAKELKLNEIGRVRLRTQQPLLFDAYRRSRETGSFILIDEATNFTVAAGMITGPSQQESHVVWHSGSVQRDERATRGMTVWLTGLSGSGKSTVAAELERRLVASGRPAYLLDGDNLRHGLNSDLGFTAEDRAGERPPGRRGRQAARRRRRRRDRLARQPVRRRPRQGPRGARGRPACRSSRSSSTPRSRCARRATRRACTPRRVPARSSDFTGVNAPYEAPESPHLRLRPEDGDAAAQAALVLRPGRADRGVSAPRGESPERRGVRRPPRGTAGRAGRRAAARAAQHQRARGQGARQAR